MLLYARYIRIITKTPRVGLEPTTPRLTAVCSTIELSGIILGKTTADRQPARVLFPFFVPSELHTKIPSLPHTFSDASPPKLSLRPISTCQLHALLHFHLRPIYLVVFKGSYCLTGISHLEGGFTLRCLQRLSLPDLATLPWGRFPTGTPAVRPSRSSRTKDSSSQISYAHAG